MAGRKPKPTAVKKLEGNPGKRKLNTKEPVPGKGMPDCPKWLLPDAKEEWVRLSEKLNQMGVLTEVERSAFAAYCQSYARWKEAQEHIDSEGATYETENGMQRPNPWVAIYNTEQRLMMQAASEFGLTPSARSRIMAASGVGKDDEDWEDEANWYKVNPSLGYTVDIERLRDAYREAKQNPADEVTFKWLRLNMWVSSTVAWISDALFMEGNEEIDLAALEGRDCYGGLDLSSTGDITALVLMFPPRDEDEKYILLPFFWVPEETIPQRVKAASVPYDIWEKQGYLLSTEGNVIHYDFIEKFINDLAEKYHIVEIAVDRWNATQMIQNLEGDGFTMVPFGQGFASMSGPTKDFYRLLMEGQIIHGGHPVLRWMAGNVAVDTDPAGNIKVTKARSKEKIDGIVAAIMALDRCIRNQTEPQGSVYDERGLLVF